MATIVASRYAVLSVDDDDDDADRMHSNKKKISKKKTVVKCQNPVSSKPDINQKKKKKQENQTPQNIKKINKSLNCNAAKKKKNELASEQWEEWKEKDNQRIQENFEEDLSKAILLSKLDYEKRKEYHKTLSQNVENQANEKKKKKTKVISLNEVNDTTSKSNKNNNKLKAVKTENVNEKSEFFKTLNKEIKKEISKENSSSRKKVNDSISQESLTLVLYQASIDKKDREIVQLKAEIETLNIQLKNVKMRNTKLCQIIASGEMKDKAEVLMEVERLQMIKDELSSEVANLHIQLEQERSKVRQLTAEHKTKDKLRKIK